MKTIILFFVFYLCLLISCDSSTGPSGNNAWILQRDKQDSITYYSIFFSDRNNGWICGSGGTIKNSTDGGKTWLPQQSGVTANLWDISFINSLSGWICGEDNTILKTSDGGRTWSDISPSSEENRIFVSIKFTDGNNGWISSNSGSILRTTDGGVSWSVKKSGLIGASYLSVLDAETVYALSGKFYKTISGGGQWDSAEVHFPEGNFPAGIFFHDNNNGWISIVNLISSSVINDVPVFFTNDGGKTWTASEMIKDGGLRCIYFINKNLGWTAGLQNIYRTTDGGRHWKAEFSPSGGFLFAKDICFVDENCGWILNWDGAVYKYTDRD